MNIADSIFIFLTGRFIQAMPTQVYTDVDSVILFFFLAITNCELVSFPSVD